VTIEDFPAYARAHWPTVREQIEQGQYVPQPVRRVELRKPGGGTRKLGIPVIVALVQRGGVVRGYAFPDDLKKRYARCGRSSAYQPQACG
jgi:hypothetical protein